jgi:hypothetical protein
MPPANGFAAMRTAGRRPDDGLPAGNAVNANRGETAQNQGPNGCEKVNERRDVHGNLMTKLLSDEGRPPAGNEQEEAAGEPPPPAIETSYSLTDYQVLQVELLVSVCVQLMNTWPSVLEMYAHEPPPVASASAVTTPFVAEWLPGLGMLMNGSC